MPELLLLEFPFLEGSFFVNGLMDIGLEVNHIPPEAQTELDL